MEAVALERQKRLAALRPGHAKVEPGEGGAAAVDGKETPAGEDGLQAAEPTVTIEEASRSVLLGKGASSDMGGTAAKGKASSIGLASLSDIIPKKIDWDLKEEYARRTEALEEATSDAITAIIRERIRASSGATVGDA